MPNSYTSGDVIKRSSYGLSDVDKIVEKFLLPFWREGAIFAFSGEIGAGKTTLLKVLLRRAGVVQEIVSPTYAYFCRYDLPDDVSVYHFDLYRVESLEMFYDMEFESVFHNSRNIVVIEWPKVIHKLLAEEPLSQRVVWVDLDYDLESPRERVFHLQTSSKNLAEDASQG